MLMYFFVRLRNPIQFASFSLGGFFYGPILFKIERKVENHWSHSTFDILGFVLYKYQLSAVLNNTTINYGRIIGDGIGSCGAMGIGGEW